MSIPGNGEPFSAEATICRTVDALLTHVVSIVASIGSKMETGADVVDGKESARESGEIVPVTGFESRTEARVDGVHGKEPDSEFDKVVPVESRRETRVDAVDGKEVGRAFNEVIAAKVICEVVDPTDNGSTTADDFGTCGRLFIELVTISELEKFDGCSGKVGRNGKSPHCSSGKAERCEQSNCSLGVGTSGRGEPVFAGCSQLVSGLKAPLFHK